MITSVSLSAAQPMTGARSSPELMQTAKDLEAAFLSEMLSFSGLGDVSEAFGGGTGEKQFASFLRAEQARLMVDRGGVGLAELIFDSLKASGGSVDG